jgi:hypothetical protein
MEEGPHSASPDLFTEVTDKDQTVSVTPDNKLNISSPMLKRRRQRNKKPTLGAQNLEAGFELYLGRNFERVSLEHPEWSTKMVEEYIMKEWKETDNILKPK